MRRLRPPYRRPPPGWPVHVGGEAKQVQGQLRGAAHGIDIAQGIGGSHLAKGIGIIHHGRKKIHGLYNGKLVAYPVYGCIIAGLHPHQQVGVRHARQAGQHILQDARPYFGRSASAGGHFGKVNLFPFRHEAAPFYAGSMVHCSIFQRPVQGPPKAKGRDMPPGTCPLMLAILPPCPVKGGRQPWQPERP